MTRYPIAEKFKAPQGEGLHTGVPMAFIRTVGCSVGQKVCTACDTHFDRSYVELGGGLFTPAELMSWVGDYRHVCITGGEPFDRDLRPLIFACVAANIMWHAAGWHMIAQDVPGGTMTWHETPLWVTVSPKPRWLPDMLLTADEVKVILGGLGDGPGWPTLEQAVQWAGSLQCPVYVQPRNQRDSIDAVEMAAALAVVDAYPVLRLSAQLHKYTRTR